VQFAQITRKNGRRSWETVAIEAGGSVAVQHGGNTGICGEQRSGTTTNMKQLRPFAEGPFAFQALR
jgi:hypothetical protein